MTSRQSKGQRKNVPDSGAGKVRDFATTRITNESTKSKRSNKSPAQNIKLPLNMSQRAVEKSIVIKREFDDQYRRSMYRVAYTTGICFLLIGAAYSGSELVKDVPISGQAAQIADTVEKADLSTNTVVPPPDASLRDTVPTVMRDETTFRLETRYTKRIVVKVRNHTNGGFMPDLPAAHQGDGLFSFTVPAQSYAPSTYQLIIIVEGENGSTATFPSNYFTVARQTDEVNEGQSTEELNLPDLTINNETNLVERSTLQRESTFEDPSPVQAPFTLFRSERTLSGSVTIGVNPPEKATFLELYALQANDPAPRFVGLASMRFERWQFVFDSRSLPNGDYQFYAQTRLDGRSIETPKLRLTVQNALGTTVGALTETNTSAPTPNIDSEPIRAIEQRRSIVPVGSLVLDDSSTAQAGERVRTESERLIRDNADHLSELIREYIAAQNSTDENAVVQRRQMISDKQSEFVRSVDTLSDIEQEELEQQLQERISRIQDNALRFERIRQVRTTNSPALQDTDGDGISDVDERELYGTDPNNPDTDGDGVPDGVEIIRGLDPLSPEPQAQIRFESPKETVALVRDDALTIESVTAITTTPADEATSTPVQTQIRGTALPNSFVTLYIFSTPTVVTIRTDTDGSFVYTFEQELEDGAHDVYVAMTDSTGRIVAQSSPFSFIKRAEAFTPVDAADAQVISTDTAVNAGLRGYNIAVGVGVLALGIILLMLGIGLRTKDEELQQVKGASPENGDFSSVTVSPQSKQAFEHIDAS